MYGCLPGTSTGLEGSLLHLQKHDVWLRYFLQAHATSTQFIELRASTMQSIKSAQLRSTVSKPNVAIPTSVHSGPALNQQQARQAVPQPLPKKEWVEWMSYSQIDRAQ
jgi:hypothetical protein